MQMLRKNLFFDTLVYLQLMVKIFSVDTANDDNLNKFIELNKFLNNLCIIRISSR